MSMKEKPKELRPYERCMEYGPEVLNDAELLAVVLRTGAVGVESVELGSQILHLVSPQKGIAGLGNLSMRELMEIKGIGKVKAVQIQCIVELSRRMSKAIMAESVSFHNPASVAQYYMEDLRHLTQEQMTLILLNTKSVRMKEIVIFKGTVNSSIVSPREIFVEAMRYGAVFVVLLHNHPSGDPTPSTEDILVTKRLREAGKIVGIPLIDHIIIGDNNYVSLKERGIFEDIL